MFGVKSISDNKSKKLMRGEIKSLIDSYLRKEASSAEGKISPGKVLELEHMTKMVVSLLEGIASLDTKQLSSISSLTPILSGCIQTDDRSVRTAVHALLQKIFQLSEEGDEE